MQTVLKKILKIIVVLYVFSITLQLNAQTKELDSLESLLQKHTEEDTIRVNLLNEAAYKFHLIDFNKNLIYAEKAYELAAKLNFTKGEAISLRRIGIYYYITADYFKALEYGQKSLKMAEESAYQKGIARACNNIGMIYRSQGDYPQALEYFQRSLTVADECDDKWGTSLSYNNIGKTHILKKEYPLSLEYYKKALVIKKEFANRNGIAACYYNIGNIYKFQGNYSGSLEYFQKSLEISIETVNKSTQCRNYTGLGTVYLAQNKAKQAYNYSKKAFVIAKETGEANFQMESSKILAKSCEMQGLYKEAYKYHVIFKTVNDSIFNENNIKKITGLEYQYKFDGEKQAIELKQQKKDAILEEKAKRQKIVRNSLVAGFVFVLILGLVIFWSFLVKQKANRILAEQKSQIEKTNEELLQQKEEIQSQAEELQTKNEKLTELDKFKEEMTGMIVHDLKNPLNLIINLAKNTTVIQSGKQMLNMIMNILDVHKYEEIQMTVDKTDNPLYEISQNAIREVRFLAEQKNIAIVNNIAPKLGVKCDKEITERILVNIMTNAIKYTPNNGKVELKTKSEIQDSFVCLQVSDTGQGIPQNQLKTVFDKFGQVSAKKSGSVRSTGLGLTFCKMAIEAHGGEITVESEINKSTIFSFTLPEGTAVESVQSQQEQQKTNKNLSLSDTDIAFLKPYLQELNKLMVFQTSSVENILDNINYQENERVKNWISNVNSSLFATNEQKYKELVNI